MSIPCGILLNELAAQINDPRPTADATFKRMLLTKLNEAMREVASSYSWTTLKKVVTLTDDSYIVPADMLRILRQGQCRNHPSMSPPSLR